MAATAPTYLAGYNAVVTIDSVAQKWMNANVKHTFGTFDATNASTSGAAFPERTIESASGSFDVPALADGTIPTFVVGSIYAATIMRKSTKGYACNILITDSDERIDVKGGVTISYSFVSQGAITLS